MAKQPRNKPRSDMDKSGTTQINKKEYVYKMNAKRRGYKYDLSREEFEELLFGDCHYCGEPPNTPYTNDTKRKFAQYIIINTIDRIDSTQGYTKDNCVSACNMCNRMKSDFSEDDWYAQMRKILEHKEET